MPERIREYNSHLSSGITQFIPLDFKPDLTDRIPV